MPTGYTADLYEGKDQTFTEFALECSRAFGALILMRDDPAGAEIPDRFEPSKYHVEQLADAKQRLIDLHAMTPEQMADAYLVERTEILAARAKDVRRRREIRQRYEAMLADVDAWEAPTADHVKLKEFMQEQLRSAIDFDCDTRHPWPEMPEGDAASWWDKKLDKARWDIDYHTAEQAKEIERADERTAWVQALKASLGLAVPA